MLIFYNTLTGRKEKFLPIHKGEARMYHCGPTVYNFAHIGNLRAYVCADILRRTLEYAGYRVTQVINITDIGHLSSDADEGEDKMIKGLRREGLPLTMEGMKALADKYENAFKEDLRALNIKTEGTQFPRASKHIADDIEIIQKLLDKDAAYQTKDGIYFDISIFREYGTKGGFILGKLHEGARIEINTEKKNPRDFALWKFSKNEMGWNSDWGKGFPGWHIECSAMSHKLLGQPFDIHTGGIDHIAIHHNNEIAQSETAYDAPLARYWLHSEFVTVAGDKMAKSEENFLTLTKLFRDEGIMPLAYRLWLLSAHYRQKVDFSIDAVLGSQTFYKRILHRINWELLSGKVNNEYRKVFLQAMYNDLDTPKAISLIPKILDDATLSEEDKTTTVREFDKILGLGLEQMAQRLHSIPDNIKTLTEERETARKNGDFSRADALRGEIVAAGFEIRDTDEGPVVRKSVS